MDYAVKKIIKNVIKRIRLCLVNKKIDVAGNVPKDIIPFPQPDADAVKLNIGGGKGHPNFDDWTVVDLRESTADIVLDITKEPLPFKNDSVDVILASHILEHIYPQQLEGVLQEFCRVLKPNSGLLRISVPDIRKAIDAYLNKDYSFYSKSTIGTFEKYLPLGGLLASWFYSTRVFKDPSLKYGDGHVHCFDRNYLGWWLHRAGFNYVWESCYKGSIVKDLHRDGIDLHENDSLYVEAIKCKVDNK